MSRTLINTSPLTEYRLTYECLACDAASYDITLMTSDMNRVKGSGAHGTPVSRDDVTLQWELAACYG